LTFEIERKFLYEEEKIALLIENAAFVSEKKLEDIYFDDDEHSLWLSDTYLRKRNGKLELKVGVQDNSGSTTVYKEYVDEDVKAMLTKPLSEYMPRITVHKKRKSYTLAAVQIDLDETDINGRKYFIGEIECVLENHEDARVLIDNIFSTYNLTPSSLGALYQYIKETDPDLFEALRRKKV